MLAGNERGHSLDIEVSRILSVYLVDLQAMEANRGYFDIFSIEITFSLPIAFSEELRSQTVSEEARLVRAVSYFFQILSIHRSTIEEIWRKPYEAYKSSNQRQKRELSKALHKTNGTHFISFTGIRRSVL